MGRKRKEALPVSSSALPALRLRTASSSSSSAAAAAASKDPEAAPLDSSSAASESKSGPPAEEPRTRSVPALCDQAEPPPPPPLPALLPDGAGLACERSSGRRRKDAMFGVFRSIPTQMDYKGQKLAEQIFQGIILFSAVIGFICGYITEQFGWTVYIVMAGFALSCLLTLPPWPIYRRNPLKWLPVQEVATDDKKPADRKVKRHPKN